MNQFAWRFIQQEDGLSALHIKVLDPEDSADRVERYTDWMLEKFTSYHHRMRVQRYLQFIAEGDKLILARCEEMAREICSPQGPPRIGSAEEYARVGVDWGSEPSWSSKVTVTDGQVVEEVVMPDREEKVLPPSQASYQPVVKRSRYLENLLREKK